MTEINKPKYTTVLIAILVFIVFLTGCLFLLNKIRDQNEKTMTAYLHDVTVQRNAVLEQHITGNLQILEGVSSNLSESGLSDEDSIIDDLYDLNKGNVFIRMGIIDMSGKADLIDLDGVVYEDIDVSSTEAFKETLKGNISITDTFYEDETGEYVNYYMVPVYKDEKMVSILCGVNNGKIFEDILDVRVFRGEGYFVAIDRNGIIVTPPADPNPEVEIGTSIFHCTEMSNEQEELLQNILVSGESEELIFPMAGDENSAVVDPLGVNDWSLISIVPRDILNEYFNQATIGVGILMGGASLFFIFILIWQIRTTNRNQIKLEELAYKDQLTGLNNYTGFRMEMNDIAKKDCYSGYAVWVMDIKEFNAINDIFGNPMGDKLIKYITEYLRKDDSNGPIAARTAVDFFVGAKKYRSREELIQFGDDLYKYIQHRDFMPENEKKIDFAIGYYIPDDFDEILTIEEMLNRATIAEKDAKKKAGTNYSFFSKEMGEELRHSVLLGAGANEALKNGELFFMLQPKVSLKGSYRVVSAEVLARWRHPEYGIISPGEFIPIFEKNGFIVTFDRYIFRKACEWYVEFRKRRKLPLELAVNVSRQGLKRLDMVDYYRDVKNEFGIPDGHLELEFTESIVNDDFDTFKDKVIKLQEAGFVCSIDDFGAGYSSLNVLKNLPIDVLKLDSAFASNVEDKARAQVIVADCISLAHKLGIITVAEGIESAEQVKFLTGIKCDLIQGYAFSPPLPVDEFEKYIMANKGKVKVVRKKKED